MTTDELENYTPKGQLTGFPKEIIAKMLDCQEEQGNKRNITVFEENKFSLLEEGGFDWDKTKENIEFWGKVIIKENFNLFFKKYPKQDNQDNSQEFNLENYVPKGDLIGFPKEIIARMLDCQEEQGNKIDISVFEENKFYGKAEGGFDWNKTKEAELFWFKVITEKNFNLFFEKYPKKEDNSQEFKVGDKVYDILLGKIGIVKRILNDISAFPIEVYYEDYGRVLYAHEGKFSSNDKYSRLLHYRDDYDYFVINFNNLPKRQYKRWRAEVGGIYYFIKRDEHDFNLDKIYRSLDYYNSFSNELYKIGNYFQTREQAQEIVDQTNTYFQKIVKI